MDYDLLSVVYSKSITKKITGNFFILLLLEWLY